MFPIHKISQEDFRENPESFMGLVDYMEEYIKKSRNSVNCSDKKIFCMQNTNHVNKDVRIMHAYDESYFCCKVMGGVDSLYETKLSSLCILIENTSMEISSIVDGNFITALRTAAMDVLASRYLAPPTTQKALIIGCGYQAVFHVPFLLNQFDDLDLYLYDKNRKRRRNLMELYGKDYPLKKTEDISRILKESDLIITLTPARSPIFTIQDVKKKVHISAVGADTKGKQEIDPNILCKSELIVDSIEQSLTSGELNVPFKKNLVNKEDIYATIFDIILGDKKIHGDKRGITVFDSTGHSIQDLIAHKWIYESFIEDTSQSSFQVSF